MSSFSEKNHLPSPELMAACRASMAAELARRRAAKEGPDNISATDSRRSWALAFAGRPVDFIGAVMGQEWWTDDWAAWRTFVRAVFGAAIPEDEMAIYREWTGRSEPSTRRQRESWCAIGRRGGKSRVLAMIGVYLACCEDWTARLAPGEVGFVRVLANNVSNASAIMGYAKAAFRHPRLAPLVVKDLTKSVELLGSTAVEVGTASIGAVRSRTIIAGLCVAAGTLVETVDGPRAIETIRVRDKVQTRGGLKSVLWAGMTAALAKVYKIIFSDGRTLLATSDHLIFVRQKGFIAVNSLRQGDEVFEWRPYATTAVSKYLIGDANDANLALRRCVSKNVETDYRQLMACGSLSGMDNVGISRKQTDIIEIEEDSYFTDKFIWRNTDLSHLGTKLWSIMITAIEKIFLSKTFKGFQRLSMRLSTVLEAGLSGVLGINDIQFAFALCGQTESRLRDLASFAEVNLNQRACDQNIVVISVEEVHGRIPVYNLKIADEPEYFANGILVHNCDEIAFWEASEESANPDSEIMNALRPAMLTMPGAMVLGASSPYARKGVLWDAYRKWYGKDGEPLVWRAPTWVMHPNVDREEIDRAYREDPVAAGAEYGAEFRSDVLGFISAEALDAVTIPGRFEVPPMTGRQYRAFVDPSGGAVDSMTLAIAHADARGVGVLDLLREVRPPFSPDVVAGEFAADCHRYGVAEIVGDRYGGEWPQERFRVRGISYVESELTKSDIYQAWLPLINAARLELLDDRRLIAQALNLERKVTRAGRDSIDHPPGGHDDVANAAAGALVLACGERYPDVWAAADMAEVRIGAL